MEEKKAAVKRQEEFSDASHKDSFPAKGSFPADPKLVNPSFEDSEHFNLPSVDEMWNSAWTY